MSEHLSDYAGRFSASAPEGTFDSSHSSFEIRDPIDSVESHEHNDHFALIHEGKTEQFETVVPYIREGLQRGEQCVYVAHDNTVDDVLDAMRVRGIDVESALESGALSVFTADESYRRTGEFDREAMVEFWEDTLETATANGFTGVRAAAEMTWALEADETGFDDLCEYEELLNPLYDGEDYNVLCQYNRDRFPADVLHDVLKTHPFLVYGDTTVCQNFYYIPPEEYFGPDQSSHELDRKLATLVDRTDARTTVETRERYQRDLYETIASPNASLDEKIEELLRLGCERLGLEVGYFTEILDGDTFEVAEAVGNHDRVEAGVTDSLDETYCEKLLSSSGPISVRDAAAVGWTDDTAYEQFGFDAYFGMTIHVGGNEYGTLCFASETPREEPYTEAERTFLDLMGQWIEYELEHQQREAFLRRSYQITSDPDLSFDDKLEQLLELGREQFGLEMAGLNQLPSWDGPFRLEKGIGLGVGSEEELWSDPGYGCFCRATVEAEEPVSMQDVSGTDWTEDTIHQEFGLTSYFGTKVSSGAKPYGTLWFGSTEARDRPFSETERTFLELMGQWVSYEIERRDQRQDQQALYRITAEPDLETDEKIAALLELGCERLDLPVGMLTRKRDRAFEIEQMHGSHPELGEGTLTPQMTDNYCRRVVETGDPVSVADAEAAGWVDDALYHEFGLACYAGVQLTVDDEPYGTICFTALSPRDVEFTESEQTFLDLMGQCVSYELERNHREDQLQRKNDRLESFASMLAHELRNPVAIGQIYSQQLPDDADSETVEYVTDAFDRIEDMVDVMLVLTRGREVVEEGTPVELADVSSKAWNDVEAPDASIEVTVDRTIHADETYLHHLFRNLLENAVEHGSASSRPQDDAVEHGGSDVTVAVGNLPDGFYVADDGTGIPPEDRDAVFDQGYTTAADNGGTGLGLAFVRKLADVYGWDCTVAESEAGGARFEFRNVV